MTGTPAKFAADNNLCETGSKVCCVGVASFDVIRTSTDSAGINILGNLQLLRTLFAGAQMRDAPNVVQ